MKILVTGSNGQLGYDVIRVGLENKFNIYGVNRQDLDITIEKDVSQYIRDLKPDAIIHCAAYTAVDKAEDDKKACWDSNVLGTKYLANAAKDVNAKFVYISTDYVFDGELESAFLETDIPNPINYYGLTKLKGEILVKEILDEHFIVRISWVFGINGNNFIKSMLKLSETRNEVSVVSDQIGSPTYTYDLAKLLFDIVQSEKYGVYHSSNEGFCSWSELAEEVFRKANKEIKVNPISTEEYPTRAVRPKNSRMSKQKLLENCFVTLPTWQDAIERYIYELSKGVK